MERSSVTSAAVWSFCAEMDLGTASCRVGVPLGRTAAVMFRRFWVGMPVMVTIWLGVGGAKPPVMPVVMVVREWVVIRCKSREARTFLQAEGELGDRHGSGCVVED